ncbi:MAG: hypothetical protein RMK01_10960 [Thermomicrobium sp.]|nr:hypothetical protein [Thermomicrobium sp.]MDW8060582.1 hypothetical protein [Thermomicrobium sp.]
METLVLLAIALAAAGVLAAGATLALRWLGVAPARPEERTRGIELLLARLRERFARRATR